MRIFRLSVAAALTAFTAILVGCGVPPISRREIACGVETDTFPGADLNVAENISESVLPPIEVARLSFIAAGDNVIHPCIYMDAERRAAAQVAAGEKNIRKYNFKPMYADVAEYIASFDLAFINQETLMAGEEFGYSGYPTFNSPRDLAYDLAEIGFDIVNIANNHMCDKGTAGLSATVDFWKGLEAEVGVTMIGGYSDRDDFNTPRIIERDGVKIALIGYTEMTNGIRLSKNEPFIPYTTEDNISQQIAAAREAADIVIVSVHWGNENWNIATKEQKQLAKLFCDSGADVIIGHHPHVLQPIEWIESTNGKRSALCIYSLGNFVSAMVSWENMVGGFFTFDIVKMSDGSCFIDSPAFVPTVFYYGPSYFNSHVYFLNDYAAEKAKTHGTYRIYGSYASPDDINKYVKKLIGDYVSDEDYRADTDG